MTPKEKAKELIDKFELVERKEPYQDGINLFEAKQCALISVNEILELGFLTGGRDHERVKESQLWYWLEVKLEIENA